MYYTIDTEGTGVQPQENSNVTIVYKGIFLKGKAVFDQSSAAGATFNLRNLISGWKEGIPYFKAGGSGKLIVPAHLGYGSFTQNGILGGSVLIFEIKLLSVN